MKKNKNKVSNTKVMRLILTKFQLHCEKCYITFMDLNLNLKWKSNFNSGDRCLAYNFNSKKKHLKDVIMKPYLNKMYHKYVVNILKSIII